MSLLDFFVLVFITQYRLNFVHSTFGFFVLTVTFVLVEQDNITSVVPILYSQSLIQIQHFRKLLLLYSGEWDFVFVFVCFF